MNVDEVDEVVRVMDLLFRTVYHEGRAIVCETRGEAEKLRQEFSRGHHDAGAANST
ncbi:MAG: hypothetical protein IJG37_09815 [Synergistaceae bacterium]|nr:hypothetical protein [Synergistaceae bacterium]MBQ6972616.1 hypothetical protein [Synergistaceae bacterium]